MYGKSFYISLVAFFYFILHITSCLRTRSCNNLTAGANVCLYKQPCSTGSSVSEFRAVLISFGIVPVTDPDRRLKNLQKMKQIYFQIQHKML